MLASRNSSLVKMELLEKIRESKELLYFALCKPHDFSKWMEEHVLLRRLMRGIHQQFFSSGTPHAESDIVDKQNHVFQLSKMLERQQKKLYESLLKFDTYRSMYQPVIIRLCELLAEQAQLFIHRDSLLLASEVDNQDELVKKEMKLAKHNLKAQLATINYLPTEDAAEIKKYLLSIFQVQEDIFHARLDVERLIRETKQYHALTVAVVILMMENDTRKMQTVLDTHDKFAEFMGGFMDQLKPLQDKFSIFLRDHVALLPTTLTHEYYENKDKAKREAVQIQQTKLKHERKQVQLHFFNEQKTQEANYQTAMLYYQEGKHVAALQLLVNNAKSFHVPSLIKAGEMFAKGEGCFPEPLLAISLLQAAHVLAKKREEFAAVLRLLLKVHEMAETHTGNEENNSLAEIDKQLQKISEACSRLRLQLNAMQENTSERLFNLGNTYIDLFQAEQEKKEPFSSLASVYLINACQFFSEACLAVKQKRDKFYMMVENGEFAMKLNLKVAQNEYQELTQKLTQIFLPIYNSNLSVNDEALLEGLGEDLGMTLTKTTGSLIYH